MKTYSTVAGVVRFKDKFLLLKRTPNRRHSPYKWQTISGHIREKESAEEAVLRELKEEASLFLEKYSNQEKALKFQMSGEDG